MVCCGEPFYLLLNSVAFLLESGLSFIIEGIQIWEQEDIPTIRVEPLGSWILQCGKLVIVCFRMLNHLTMSQQHTTYVHTTYN